VGFFQGEITLKGVRHQVAVKFDGKSCRCKGGDVSVYRAPADLEFLDQRINGDPCLAIELVQDRDERIEFIGHGFPLSSILYYHVKVTAVCH